MNTNIDQVTQAFTEWRANRKKRSHTPAHLRALAIGLVDHYPVALICERLNINARSIKSWSELTSAQEEAFVTLPEDTLLPSAPVEQDVQLKIVTPSGIECHLSGNLQAPFIASLLRSVREEAVQ